MSDKNQKKINHPWRKPFTAKQMAEEKKRRHREMYGKGGVMPLPRLKD